MKTEKSRKSVNEIETEIEFCENIIANAEEEIKKLKFRIKIALISGLTIILLGYEYRTCIYFGLVVLITACIMGYKLYDIKNVLKEQKSAVGRNKSLLKLTMLAEKQGT